MAEETKVHVCDLCGHNEAQAIQPKEDETKQYLRCLLSSKPFCKSYELFKGALVISFRSLTTKESDVLTNLVDQIQVDNQLQYSTEVIKLKLIFYMTALGDKKYELPEDLKTYEEAHAIFEERFGDVSEDLVALVIRTFNEFMTLVAVLGRAGFDGNFWKGAGLA